MTLFLILAGVLTGTTALAGARFLYRQRRSAKATWGQLVARLEFVDPLSLELIALNAAEGEGGSRRLEPEDVWRMIGGLPGLQRLERNSAVLIDMACHLQQWYPEAVLTAEELRVQARELRWHVDRLRAAARNDKLEAWISANVQSAAAAYYRMTRSLLALTEAAALESAVEW
jgi:hypothetical protein